MVQLKILSGARAGSVHLAREFPCVVGRAAAAQLRLEAPGVWDQHLRLELKFPDGFELVVQPGALASVNGQPCQQAWLRNGDNIEIGSVKFQFWLSEVEQPSTVLRENVTWLALAALGLAQVALIWWLIRMN